MGTLNAMTTCHWHLLHHLNPCPSHSYASTRSISILSRPQRWSAACRPLEASSSCNSHAKPRLGGPQQPCHLRGPRGSVCHLPKQHSRESIVCAAMYTSYGRMHQHDPGMSPIKAPEWVEQPVQGILGCVVGCLQRQAGTHSRMLCSGARIHRSPVWLHWQRESINCCQIFNY